jgi:hypothetical protein
MLNVRQIVFSFIINDEGVPVNGFSDPLSASEMKLIKKIMKRALKGKKIDKIDLL